MNRFLTSILAFGLILAPAAPTVAQPVPRLTYEEQQQAYEQAMRDYKEAQARYEADRAAYDRRYGAGAYDRKYGAPSKPAQPAAQPTKPTLPGPETFKPVAPPPAITPAPFAPVQGPPYLGASCGRRSETSRAGLAEAMAGSLGAGGPTVSSKTEGAVLGALIDGTLGANLADSESSARRYAPECDAEGFYFNADQTFRYRESSTGRRIRNGRHDESFYIDQGCRLAVAPMSTRSGAVEYHYARVCPDNRKRYRFAD